MKQPRSDSMIALLGEILDRLKAVEQIQTSLISMQISMQSDLSELKASMAEVKSELVAIREVLINHSSDIDDHNGRINRLERAML